MYTCFQTDSLLSEAMDSFAMERENVQYLLQVYLWFTTTGKSGGGEVGE